MSPTTDPKVVARFWSYIDKQSNGCWLWRGDLDQDGYGWFLYRAALNTRKKLRAHRFSWELHNGPIPKDQVVCHRCNNPPCCNPAHLFLGSNAQNQWHRFLQGRIRILNKPVWRRLIPRRYLPVASPEERFWKNVNKTDGCWLWTGAISTGTHYGILSVNGQRISAHRFSWQIHHGAIAKGLSVLHRCDVRNCVRPEHLFVGSQSDNMRDKIAKGRDNPPHGERHRKAKVTAKHVLEIRQLIASGEQTCAAVAKRFGLDASQVSRIAHGKSWKHV